MRLSVVVVVYDMPHAAPRTLTTLSPAFQRGLDDDYEIIVVDNGSPRPMPVDRVERLGANVRYLSLAHPQPSPAAAANCGLALASGDVVGLILDGARLATPRLLEFAWRAANSHPRAIVSTVGWLLGYGSPERHASADDAEAAMRTEAILASIDWPRDPYRLFEVARLDGSMGYFGLGFESGAFFMPRALWRELDGLDERFDVPGGGFAALDLYARAHALPDCEPMLLLGEGTVHQPHGGVSTDRPIEDLAQRFMRWREHYMALRGHDLPLRTPPLTYFGSLPAPWRVQFLAWLVRETASESPALADLVPRVAGALAAAPTPQGTAWAELYAAQSILLEARQAAADAATESAGLRARVDALEGSWSWRLTAPLRWLATRLGSRA